MSDDDDDAGDPWGCLVGLFFLVLAAMFAVKILLIVFHTLFLGGSL